MRSKSVPFIAGLVLLAVTAHHVEASTWPPLGGKILHSLHGPGFALVALIILWYLQGQCQSAVNYILAGGIAIGIGLLSEIAQIPGPRDAQLSDIVIDTLGVFGALGVVASLDKKTRAQMSRSVRVILAGFATVALALAVVPTIWFGYALLEQKSAFPTLLSLESRWEFATLSKKSGAVPSRIGKPRNWPAEGATIGRAVEQGHDGIFLSHHPLPDWRAYEQLSLVLATESSTHAVAICIRDQNEELEPHSIRVCTQISAKEKPEVVVISFDDVQKETSLREFDFSRVDALVLSAAKPGTNAVLLLDDIRLE